MSKDCYIPIQTPGPEVIKLFTCSSQLIMKFQLLINVEVVKNCGKFRFKTQKLVIYPAHKCKNANNCWHFYIYEQDKFYNCWYFNIYEHDKF